MDIDALFYDLDKFAVEFEPLWKRHLLEDARIHRDRSGNLGALQKMEGKLTEAGPYLREAVRTGRSVNGNDSPITLSTEQSLAQLLRVQNKLPEAESIFHEMLEVQKRKLGPTDPDTQNTMIQLASVLRTEGKLSEAEFIGREAVSACEKTNPPDAAMTGNARLALGRTLLALKRFVESEAELTKANQANAITPATSTAKRLNCLDSIVSLYETWQAASPVRALADKLARAKDGRETVRATTRPTTRLTP